MLVGHLSGWMVLLELAAVFMYGNEGIFPLVIGDS